MSATGQAAGGGDAGQGDAGQGGEAAQGFDASALAAQIQAASGGVDDLRSQFGQFDQRLDQIMQALPQQEADPDPGLDLSYLDQGLYNDPGVGDSEREQFSQHLTGQIDQRIQQAIEAATQPGQERIGELERQLEIRDLIAEHPEFQDREIAEQIAGPNGLARQAAEALGDPRLAQKPAFWGLVYKANRANTAANDEQGGADAPNAATLEGATGAGPGGGGQVDIAGQIIGARKGSSVLPFG